MTTLNTHTPIAEVGLAATVKGQMLIQDMRDRLIDALFADDGIDESPAKMIWLAVGVGLAIAAGSFVITQFNDAKGSVPAPTPPAIP